MAARARRIRRENMEFEKVIKVRRSVRSFDDTEVKDEIISQILEDARLAPSWANRQCWSFIVITDKNKIKKIIKHGGSGINKWLKNAPVLIIACGDPKLSGNREGIGYFAVDVAIALEHLVLSAANLGLGSCWIGTFHENNIKGMLNIPKDIRIVAMTPIGHPKDKLSIREKITSSIVKSKNRKPLNEIAHYNKW